MRLGGRKLLCFAKAKSTFVYLDFELMPHGCG